MDTPILYGKVTVYYYKEKVKWDCLQCGITNYPSKGDRCIVCNFRRKKWICPQCSFHNELSWENCFKCHFNYLHGPVNTDTGTYTDSEYVHRNQMCAKVRCLVCLDRYKREFDARTFRYDVPPGLTLSSLYEMFPCE